MRLNNNPINNRSEMNPNLQANPAEKIIQQEGRRLNGIGNAIVNIANNAYEFVASLSPLYGVAPHPDGQVNVAWDNLDLQGIALEVLRHIPGIGGAGVAVNNAARVLQLVTMMRAVHAAGDTENTASKTEAASFASTTEAAASTASASESVTSGTMLNSSTSTVSATSLAGQDSVIEISTAEGLAQMANSSGHFRLTQDISAESNIGDIPGFSGTFDGNGFTISGLHHPLFIDLRGKVSDLTISGTMIFIKDFDKNQVLYPSIGALACDTYDANITNVIVRDSNLVARRENGAGQAFAGGVVGRNFGDSTFKNIALVGSAAKAEGGTSATAGGVLGTHVNGTLSAEGLRVRRGKIFAGASNAIAAGAIGDVGTGCNQAGGELTCNNISTEECTVNSFGRGEKTQNSAISAGILTGSPHTIEGQGFSAASNNILHADCKESTIGSLENCTATTPTPHQAFTANPHRGTTKIVQTVAPLPAESTLAINAALAASYTAAFAVGAASFLFASSYLQAYRSGARGKRLAMAPFRQLSNALLGRQSHDLYDGELEAVVISQSDLSARDKRRLGMYQTESQFLVIEEGSKVKEEDKKVQANSHSACECLNRATEKVTSCFAGSNLSRNKYIELVNQYDSDDEDEFFDTTSSPFEHNPYSEMTPGDIRLFEQSKIALRREQSHKQPKPRSSQPTFIQPSSEAVQEGFDSLEDIRIHLNDPNTLFAYSNPTFDVEQNAEALAPELKSILRAQGAKNISAKKVRFKGSRKSEEVHFIEPMLTFSQKWNLEKTSEYEDKRTAEINKSNPRSRKYTLVSQPQNEILNCRIEFYDPEEAEETLSELKEIQPLAVRELSSLCGYVWQIRENKSLTPMPDFEITQEGRKILTQLKEEEFEVAARLKPINARNPLKPSWI